VIFATSQYVSEGLDIPAIDTLVLATPMYDVEQAVGRIQRPLEGKKDPIVVDIRDDNIRIFRAAGEARDRFYPRVT
jgi:superfamily II DNA or RNA helicase